MFVYTTMQKIIARGTESRESLVHKCNVFLLANQITPDQYTYLMKHIEE